MNDGSFDWGFVFLAVVALVPTAIGVNAKRRREDLPHSEAPQPTFSWLMDSDESSDESPKGR
jgi:hypothetical protein